MKTIDGEMKGTRTLCVDLDNVIAQTDAVLRDVIRRHTNGRVDLAYTDILEFNYWECKDATGQCISKEDWHPIHLQFSRDEVLATILPVGGIQECLAALGREYVLHIVTARIPEARAATIAWLKEHRIPHDQLVFTSHRQKHRLAHQYVAAIEDDYDQAKAFADAGISAYLVRHPWNVEKQRHPQIRWVADWPQLCDELLRIV